MTVEDRLKLIELFKEDQEIKQLVAEHNKQIEESFKERTMELKQRSDIHTAKVSELFRSMGVPQNFNLLELVMKVTSND